MRQKPVEILAPAGSVESMKAAVAAGADAVYIGGSKFGARAYAGNPEEDRLLEAIDYVHLHGKRLYLTVNTLMKDQEMEELYDYLLPYYRQGLDAAIVQDMGVFSFVRKNFPDLAVHASTQMTITGAYGARMLKEMGAERVVTARELSLKEIRNIHDQVDIEIESFVHGALCYCYSGQCLFSSLIGGRSGNRGRCAQPCRLPYDIIQEGKTVNAGDRRYVMSLKDLCTLDLIPDLLEAGIYSLKIEGRMKSPRYTAGVTAMYRRYVDKYVECGREGFRVEAADRKLLLELFDRGGQTDGYYKRHNGREMVVWKEKPAFREADEALFNQLDREYVNKQVKETVFGKIILEEGRAAQLFLECGRHSVTVAGETVLKAVNQPMTAMRVRKQMEKTGNTPFEWGHLDTSISGDLFLPVQALNELRRKGFTALEEDILGSYKRQEPEHGWNAHCVTHPEADSETGASVIPMTVSLERPDCFDVVLKFPEISEIYIDASVWEPQDWRKTVEICHQNEKACVLAMPYIFRTEAERFFHMNAGMLSEAGFDAVLVRSMEEPGFLKSHGIRTAQIFDYGMYGMNGNAQRALKNMGARRLTWPVELNSRELGRLEEKGELIIYGRLPMMITAQCLHQATGGCDRQAAVLNLKDRMGKQFPVKNHCSFCYNTIYNAEPLSLLGMEEKIRGLRPSSVRLSFTTESVQVTKRVLESFTKAWTEGTPEALFPGGFTRGHFKRGVE